MPETQLVIDTPSNGRSVSPRLKFIKGKFGRVERGEKVIDSYSCAASRKILLQGMLYVTDRSLYFYSPFNDKTLFGNNTKIAIPYD